jgi:hypothetical protein
VVVAANALFTLRLPATSAQETNNKAIKQDNKAIETARTIQRVH